ncbi:MAG: SPOR domain-containing protein [Thermoleophilia bacterium]|nr:SPOR domain-containing protein [Thermoleophilia bacterium]
MTGPDEQAGTPQEPETPETPAPEDAGPPRCRECDAVLDERQTYCLECGAPTPLAPSLRRRGGMGALAAGLAVLGVGAGFLGYAVASDDGDGGRPATVLTAPPPVPTSSTIDTTGIGPLPPDTTATTPTSPDDGTTTGFVTTTSGTTAPGTPLPGTGSTTPTDTGGGLPPDTTGSPPATTTEDTGTEPPDTAEPTSDWPAGTSAWTAIVASAEDADAARQERSRARAAGFGAGILISDDHSDLSPGLYVVYIGVYADRGRAVAMAGRARATFPGAYARYVAS